MDVVADSMGSVELPKNTSSDDIHTDGKDDDDDSDDDEDDVAANSSEGAVENGWI